MMWVENSSVHGSVISQPQTSHAGNEGRRTVMYHANAASAAIEMRLSRTYGASGTGTMLRGTPTSRPCRAPGISLFVQTTSAPEIRPGASRVVPQTQQEDLRFVLEEQLARQPVHKTEAENQYEGGRPRDRAPARNGHNAPQPGWW